MRGGYAVPLKFNKLDFMSGKIKDEGLSLILRGGIPMP